MLIAQPITQPIVMTGPRGWLAVGGTWVDVN
jgi:hypothetical protein